MKSRREVSTFVADATRLVEEAQRAAGLEGVFAIVFVGQAEDEKGPHNVVEVNGTCPRDGMAAAGKAVLEHVEGVVRQAERQVKRGGVN